MGWCWALGCWPSSATTPNRYASAKARKAYAGTAPITRASGLRQVVLARAVGNRRLTTACHLWAFAALTGSPGVRAWQTEILAWHRTAGCSNGPTEAINLLIKKVKRVGHGFRSFDNDRLRLLLHCGVGWEIHRTARLRGRSPRSVASG